MQALVLLVELGPEVAPVRQRQRRQRREGQSTPNDPEPPGRVHQEGQRLRRCRLPRRGHALPLVAVAADQNLGFARDDVLQRRDERGPSTHVVLLLEHRRRHLEGKAAPIEASRVLVSRQAGGDPRQEPLRLRRLQDDSLDGGEQTLRLHAVRARKRPQLHVVVRRRRQRHRLARALLHEPLRHHTVLGFDAPRSRHRLYFTVRV
mmetsp:Transcript_3670/g.12062  ORF Transcript_3670/g.12062 Transcript_3670/m.12062 type:complete len:205 (+) Transcript_3670:1455-2069(+)